MVILGIDYGDRRIGLAITDPLEIIASPLETVQNDNKGYERILQIIGKQNVDIIVVGLPLNMDGTQGPAADKSLAFAQKLRESTGKTVDTYDERLTTVEAERSLLRRDMSRAKRAKRIDEMAAQVILQDYLQANKNKRRP